MTFLSLLYPGGIIFCYLAFSCGSGMQFRPFAWFCTAAAPFAKAQFCTVNTAHVILHCVKYYHSDLFNFLVIYSCVKHK